jgi:hypothetical protein
VRYTKGKVTKEGDVIISFIGAHPEKGSPPLLGMMMACPLGSRVMLEIMRDGHVWTVELLHAK